MPIDKGTSKPITQLSSLQINYKDENSCFNPPIVTTSERDALINTDDPTKPIKDGTLVFNSDSGYEEYYSQTKGGWIQIKENAGGGDVSGPGGAVEGNLVAFDGTSGKVIKDSGVSTDLVVSASSASVRKGQIPVWNNTAKGKINLANSGVTVDQIKPKNTRKNVNEPELYQLSNLGALQFGSNDNVADTGVILVDGLTPVTFQTQGTGADSRVCTVINGELGEGSSSPSALLEINSSEGAFLLSRVTTAQRDALLDPKDGLICYNTDTKKLNVRENANWVEYSTGSNTGELPYKSVGNNYTATYDDCILGLDTHSSFTINLPSAINNPGKLFIISDVVGYADLYNATIKGSINGGSEYRITKMFETITIISNGSTWVATSLISGGYPSIGNVSGPSASVNNNIAVFDGTTGTLIKDSGISLSQIVSKYLPFSTASFISQYNISDNDFFVVIYAALGGTTVNLPSLGITSNLNRLIIIKQAGVGSTTIIPASPDSIQAPNQNSYVLSTNNFVWLVGNSNRYWMPICAG